MRFLTRIFPLLFLFILEPSFAQFSIDASLRPRFEYRHGYKTLFPDSADPATFVSQRTRLNFRYKMEELKFFLSVQDVRVWGDVPQMNVADNNGLSLHEAWGEVFLKPSISFKLGRQEIVYDDQRIFGNVDWVQQGRSHDAAIFKHEPSAYKFHVGVAYNQDKEALTGNLLYTNTYKSFQYLWFHKDWKKINTSFLFLNNGVQHLNDLDETENSTRNSHTTGFHLNSILSNFSIYSNLYYQFGRDISDNKLDAYLISLQGNYSPSEKWRFGLGGEWLSGNDNGSPAAGKNRAFNPLFATGHKFNGFMDYFYVGNYFDTFGLTDLFGTATFKYNSRGNIILNFHKFFASSEIDSDISQDLGFEIDLVTSYSLNKFVLLNAGYSHYFTSEGIEKVKNNYDANSNNWAWVMISINPNLFNSSEK